MHLLRVARLALVVATVVTSSVVANAVVAQSAHAAFPGDNGRIAFVRAGNIFTIRPDGTGIEQLTWDGRSGYPAWGPGGHRILYTRSTIDSSQIWLMGADGRHKVRVPTGPASYQPAWSPDATRFVFTSVRKAPGQQYASDQLYVFDFATGRVVQITAAAGDGLFPYSVQPAWSPLGDRIVFSRNVRNDDPTGEAGATYDLMMVRPDGTHLTPITTRGATGPGRPDWLGGTWSPGGWRIACYFGDSVGGRDFFGFRGLEIRGVHGTLVRAFPATGEIEPTWSPDGTMIAAVRPSFRNNVGPLPRPGLWLLRPYRPGGHRILAGSDISDPDWGRRP